MSQEKTNSEAGEEGGISMEKLYKWGSHWFKAEFGHY